MDIFWWVIIAISFVLSFIGIVYPIIPGILMVWVGVAVYHFFIDAAVLTQWTWVTLLLLTAATFLADQVASVYFAKRFGGSKKGMQVAVIGAIAGVFLIPPVGVLVVPFVLVLLTELLQQQTPRKSLLIAFGTILALLTGALAKGGLQLLMILTFLRNVLR